MSGTCPAGGRADAARLLRRGAPLWRRPPSRLEKRPAQPTASSSDSSPVGRLQAPSRSRAAGQSRSLPPTPNHVAFPLPSPSSSVSAPSLAPAFIPASSAAHQGLRSAAEALTRLSPGCRAATQTRAASRLASSRRGVRFAQIRPDSHRFAQIRRHAPALTLRAYGCRGAPVYGRGDGGGAAWPSPHHRVRVWRSFALLRTRMARKTSTDWRGVIAQKVRGRAACAAG